MGWKGESRRHSLSRKGIKTNLPDGRRFDVSNYVARGRKQETIELREFLDSYMQGSRVYEQEPFDDNHPYRRFFRLMMDGSYKGEDYYLRIKERIEETNGNEKKLRSIAIQISMDLLEAEFPDLSRSTIQKNVVDVFGKDAEKINEQLIDDLKDFAKAHEMEWAMKKASGKLKEIDLPNSNIYVKGFGTDINGNKIIKLSYPNGRGFSIQTLQSLPSTHSMRMGSKDDLGDISESEIAIIEAEVVNHIEKFGSANQKRGLRTYR
ncbi:hypothetical protein KAU43_07725 [candidate division WOR-3 bacterium]|nr:hypothetical protein [candidate division WOR-3 bacterium]